MALVTWEVLSAFVAAVVAVVIAAFVVWWRIEGKVKEAKDSAYFKCDATAAKAEQTARQLAAHKVHVAEPYVSKAGTANPPIRS